jgi:hypothetical protein
MSCVSLMWGLACHVAGNQTIGEKAKGKEKADILLLPVAVDSCLCGPDFFYLSHRWWSGVQTTDYTAVELPRKYPVVESTFLTWLVPRIFSA